MSEPDNYAALTDQSSGYGLPAEAGARRQPTPVYVPAPARLSIWRIAAAVFVGNAVCVLLGCALYFCVFIGLGLLNLPQR